MNTRISTAGEARPRSRCHWIRRLALLLVAVQLSPVLAHAGGPWLPGVGHGYLFFGYSRKTADHIWNMEGDLTQLRQPAPEHDFRHVYVYGEATVFRLMNRPLSVSALFTWLDGREGEPGHMEQNVGFADTWFGVKYGIAEGPVPMALGVTVRTPFLYDQPGPYTRQLLNAAGDTVFHSPEWRGLLKHDVTFSYHVGSSLRRGQGWTQAELGYSWREGAPADNLLFNLDVGHNLPVATAKLKLNTQVIYGLGNDSPSKPDDRFSSAIVQAFHINVNDMKSWRAGASVFVPVGRQGEWMIEAGFNTWLWGRSSWKYNEPFLSVGKAW